MTFRFASYKSDLYLNIKDINLKMLEVVKLVFSKKFTYLAFLILPVYTLTDGTSLVGISLIDKYEFSVNKGEAMLYFSCGMVSGIVLISLIGNLIKSRLKIIRIMAGLIFIQTSFTTLNTWVPENTEFLNGFFKAKYLNFLPYL